MAHLYFIRSKTTWECEDYYESKTDVWMFGDRAGYQHFLEALAKAETARRPIDLHKDISRGRNSMYVILLPAVMTVKTQARLRLIERIVFRTSKPAMELVITANAAGYRRLATLVHDPGKSFHAEEPNDQKRSFVLIVSFCSNRFCNCLTLAARRTCRCNRAAGGQSRPRRPEFRR